MTNIYTRIQTHSYNCISSAAMGNIYGFRFSDILRFIPNVCACPRRGRGRGRGSTTDTGAKLPRPPPPHLESGRESYYISSRDPAVVGGHQCFSRRTAPETSKVRACRRDFNIDIALEDYVPVLPPIVTKPSKAMLKEPGPTVLSSVNCSRRRRRRSYLVEIQHRQSSRVNYTSPRMHLVTRKKLRSIVVVKTSVDPQTEFRDSMVEMIVENKITSKHDLEELLACYLSLNSNEFHDVIVKVFRQIWLRLNR